jgi:hypothetical protein
MISQPILSNVAVCGQTLSYRRMMIFDNFQVFSSEFLGAYHSKKVSVILLIVIPCGPNQYESLLLSNNTLPMILSADRCILNFWVVEIPCDTIPCCTALTLESHAIVFSPRMCFP